MPTSHARCLSRSRLRLLLAVLVGLALLGPAGCAAEGLHHGQSLPPGYVTEVPEPYRGTRNPFTPADVEAVAAGQGIYLGQCFRCHGPSGRGDGPQAATLEPQPADFAGRLLLEAFRQHQDLVYYRVAEGIERTGMPPFGHRLTEEEIWQVLTYAWHLGEAAGN